jgi:hypothetical protein
MRRVLRRQSLCVEVLWICGLCVRFSSFSVEFDGFKLKASGYGDVERLCTLLRLFKDYSLSAEVDVGRI